MLQQALTDTRRATAVEELAEVAAGLGCSLAQLSIAWVASNPRVSTVITGASKLAQLEENLGALAVLPKLTPEVRERIDAISAPVLA